MIEILRSIGVSLLFGFGFSLIVLGLSLFYNLFLDSEGRQSSVALIGLAFLSLFLGGTFLFFVIV